VTRHRRCFAAALLSLSACASAGDPTPPALAAGEYGLHYQAELQPASGDARVRITVEQSRALLLSLDFNAPASRYRVDGADGDWQRRGDRVLWEPPPGGGSLRLRTPVDHQRDDGEYDARMTDRWALLRLDDLFPAARVRTLAGAESVARLSLSAPDGWGIETRYGPDSREVPVPDPDRRFDRPTGWMVAGEIGVRRERLNGRDLAVAGPTEHDLRRMDMLAFLLWALPEFVAVFEGFPERLLIVSAQDAMWRGGLSGPGSFYIHAERPLISENGTSPLMHELAHIAMAIPPTPGSDWVVEGLAEYYGMELLRRSGGLSDERVQRTLDDLREWSHEDGGRLRDPSTGADTACAVLVFHHLAGRLDHQGKALDQIVRDMLAAGAPDGRYLQDRLARLGVEPPARLARTLCTAH